MLSFCFTFLSFFSELCSKICLFLWFRYTGCSRALRHWCFDHATPLKENKVGADPESKVELRLVERRNSSQVKLDGSKYDNIHDQGEPGASRDS